MKKIIIAIAITAAALAAFFIPVGIHTARENKVTEEVERLLQAYGNSINNLQSYRDDTGHITRVDVSTDFYTRTSESKWGTQYCDVDLNVHLDDSFEELSETKKCQFVYDETKKLRKRFENIRSDSAYMCYRQEHAKGGYLHVNGYDLGYSDTIDIYFWGKNRYVFYNITYYVDGAVYKVNWNGEKVISAIPAWKTHKKKKEEDNPAGSTGSYHQGNVKFTEPEKNLDDQDVESYYYDYRSDFENEEDAWDDLEDNPDEWD